MKRENIIVAVVDGLGGGIGKSLVEKLKKSYPWLYVRALGTNSGATARMLKAGELAAIAYQETIMASILGLVLFGETLTTFQLIGGVLIIAGGVGQVLASTKSVEEKSEEGEDQEEVFEVLPGGAQACSMTGFEASAMGFSVSPEARGRILEVSIDQVDQSSGSTIGMAEPRLRGGAAPFDDRLM